MLLIVPKNFIIYQSFILQSMFIVVSFTFRWLEVYIFYWQFWEHQKWRRMNVHEITWIPDKSFTEISHCSLIMIGIYPAVVWYAIILNNFSSCLTQVRLVDLFLYQILLNLFMMVRQNWLHIKMLRFSIPALESWWILSSAYITIK